MNKNRLKELHSKKKLLNTIVLMTVLFSLNIVIKTKSNDKIEFKSENIKPSIILDNNEKEETKCIIDNTLDNKLHSFTLYRNKMVLVANDINKIPIATFSVSCRKNNPNVGTYEINGRKRRWATLFEDATHKKYVYGQYATTIEGHILFHSVCYKKEGDPYTLIPHCYNDIIDKKESLGCIRMRVSDAKWVYENVKPGMKIKVIDVKYDVERPQYERIPDDSIMDPTDYEANKNYK